MSRRAVELHASRAKELALRIFAYASTIVPEEWCTPYQEQALMDVYDFSIHARCINDLCKFKDTAFPRVSQMRFNLSYDEGPAFIENYHHALDKIIHAQSITVGWAIWDGPKVFLSSPTNRIFLYLKVATDRFPESARVNAYGLSNVFLTDVIAKIRTIYPDYVV